MSPSIDNRDRIDISFLMPRDREGFNALLGSIARRGYDVRKTYTQKTTIDRGGEDGVGVIERVLSEEFQGDISDPPGFRVGYSSIPVVGSRDPFMFAGIRFYHLEFSNLYAGQRRIVEALREHVR